MKRVCLLLFLLSLFFSGAQNNLRLFSADGSLFSLLINNQPVNKKMETEVLVERIYQDTLRLELRTENGKRYNLTVYLQDKGKHTSNMEFTYRFETSAERSSSVFMGMNSIRTFKGPLVAAPPIIDTSAKYKNSRMGHFCELKNGKAAYFNNLPKETLCKTSMSDDYLKFIDLLMSKAEVPDDKFTIAENTSRNNCINTSQLLKLLNYVDYELDKLKLVRIAWNNVTDKSNRQNVEKAFHFESSKTELRSFLNKFIEEQTVHSGCSKASDQKDIDFFSERLSAYSNDSQRLEAFKKSYSLYCFSKNQTQFILMKFIHDREKLEAAKLLYYYCSEKTKFEDIKEVFSYNTSAADLVEFISKQRN